MSAETSSPEPFVVGFLNIQLEKGVPSQKSRLGMIAEALHEHLADAAVIALVEVDGKKNGRWLADQLGMQSQWVVNDRAPDEHLGVMGHNLGEVRFLSLEAGSNFNACITNYKGTNIAVAHLPYRPIGGGPRRRRQVNTLMQAPELSEADNAMIAIDTNHCARLAFRQRYFAQFGFHSVFSQLCIPYFSTVATPETRPNLRTYQRLALTLSHHDGFSVDDIYNKGVDALELEGFIAEGDHIGLRAKVQPRGQARADAAELSASRVTA